MQELTKQTDFLDGIVLCIDKPLKWSSFDVVHKIRNLIIRKYGYEWIKVGHAGTLDPLATGLIIICTGGETKNIQTYLDYDKEYVATMRLGQTTPSFDLESEVDQEFPTGHITENLILDTIQDFIGATEQVPPLFSAKRLHGRRAYKLARKGENIELKPVRIRISHLELLSYYPPDLTLKIICSKGTYIRALARDIGKSLGSGAHLIALRRTAIGPVSVDQAISIDKFEKKLKNL